MIYLVTEYASGGEIFGKGVPYCYPDSECCCHRFFLCFIVLKCLAIWAILQKVKSLNLMKI